MYGSSILKDKEKDIYKGKKGFQRKQKRPGKPLLYPMEIDQEILVWFVEMIDLDFPICSYL